MLEPQPPRNIFEAVQFGEENQFRVKVKEDFTPTDALPGSREKLDIMAARLAAGYPVHHPDDRKDLEGIEHEVKRNHSRPPGAF